MPADTGAVSILTPEELHDGECRAALPFAADGDVVLVDFAEPEQISEFFRSQLKGKQRSLRL